MGFTSFQQDIEARMQRKLKLKINDNRNTMLSVRWESGCTKVSLHRMFLEAPSTIMDKLTCYIQRKDKILAPEIKAYIEDNLRKLNYSHRLNQLVSQGNVYNLKKMYEEINKEYFNNQLDLNITWFGKPQIRRRNKVVFGLYHEPTRLIKIHKILDTMSVPDYVVSYIIYHEMLHHVCPTQVDKHGCYRAHGKAFKEKEKLYRHYQLATEWLDQHEHTYFGD